MTEQQENNQPSFLDLLLEAHVGLERQGPGSRETVEIGSWDKPYETKDQDDKH